jgi:hypothetical protein
MDADKETLDLVTPIPSGEEVIKTRISFKKGLIAGILILILILAIGVLVGYGIGQYTTSSYYSQVLADQAKKCIFL